MRNAVQKVRSAVERIDDPARLVRIALTRAAFLSSGMVTTRPIMKGVYIRKYVLCDEIPDPPANASNTPIDTSTKSSRQAVEGITEQAGTSCSVCHKVMINPLGFSTENFDALGRVRKDQPLFDATGKITVQTGPAVAISRPVASASDAVPAPS